MLDELENFWEKNDLDKGLAKRGILAEHIMEKQAKEMMLAKNGDEKAQGMGAFCMWIVMFCTQEQKKIVWQKVVLMGKKIGQDRILTYYVTSVFMYTKKI